jgi:hypothetical protein
LTGQFTAMARDDAGADFGELLGCARTAERCEEVDDCLEQSEAPLLPGQLPKRWAPPGAVVLPGDRLACVNCAEQACPEAYKECFGDVEDSGAPDALVRSDDCLSYRTCLHACAQGVAKDPVAYQTCVDVNCKSYEAGVASFGRYRKCLLGATADAGAESSCAACGRVP